jgi:hypothetical protein
MINCACLIAAPGVLNGTQTFIRGTTPSASWRNMWSRTTTHMCWLYPQVAQLRIQNIAQEDPCVIA